MKVKQFQILRCNKCYHKWVARKREVNMCPSCKSKKHIEKVDR